MVKYGKENFTKRILEYCTEDNWKEREIYWIKQLDTHAYFGGYNQTFGGEGSLGRITTQETKDKISDANKGNTVWLGKKHTPEALVKISNASKGRPGYWKGRKMSDESKQKLSNSLKGIVPWNKGVPMKESTKEKKRVPKTEEHKQKLRKPKRKKEKVPINPQ